MNYFGDAMDEIFEPIDPANPWAQALYLADRLQGELAETRFAAMGEVNRWAEQLAELDRYVEPPAPLPARLPIPLGTFEFDFGEMTWKVRGRVKRLDLHRSIPPPFIDFAPRPGPATIDLTIECIEEPTLTVTSESP